VTDLEEVKRRARAAGWRVSDQYQFESGVAYVNVAAPLDEASRYPDVTLSVWADGKTYGTGCSAGASGQSLKRHTALVETMRSILLGEDLGTPLSAHDAAVLGDHLRELGVAEWRVAAALDVLTREKP
jgi:hypothetical protein